MDQEIEQQAAKLKEQKIEQDRQQELQLQAQQLLIQAQSSFQEDALQNSLAHIEQGLLAVPNHPELLALREQVRARIIEQQRQIEAHQRQEEEAQRQAKIQAKAAERQKAEQARLQTEADQYLAQALNQQRNGRYTASLQQIEKGLAAVPNHEGLLRLKEQVRAEASVAQQQEAIRHQAAKEAKQKEKETARRQTKTTSVSSPNQGGSDEALKKLQGIKDAVDALNKSLD